METHPASPCETLAERYQALLEVAQAISVHRDLHALCQDLAQRLPRVVHVNFVALTLHDPERDTMRLHTIQANVPADLVGGHEGPVEESPAGLVWQTQQPILVPNLDEERRWPTVIGHMKEDGTNSFCFVPLTTAVRRLGAMGFMSLQKAAYVKRTWNFSSKLPNRLPWLWTTCSISLARKPRSSLWLRTRPAQFGAGKSITPSSRTSNCQNS